MFAAFAIAPSFGQSGLKLPAMSPSAKIIQDFSTSSIEVSYSRPSMRERKIFGELVPYNTLWRTGANAATKIKFGEDVTVGGQEVKAGEYELFTVPGKNQWEIILNKGNGDWGAYNVDKSKDVARFMVNVKPLDRNVENFTINISNITLNTCNIDLMWEKTMVTIPVKADNEKRLLSDIDKAINNPSIPYYQAASYYYETGQNLNVAMGWVDKALAQNPNAYYMWHLKAKIAKKQGDKTEAIAAARRSMEVAKGSGAEAEYKRNNEKLIREIEKR